MTSNQSPSDFIHGNETAALLARGLPNALSEELVQKNLTLSTLKQMTNTGLRALGLCTRQIRALRSKRPPIPKTTVVKLLVDSARTCCVCRRRRQGVVIHHIEEWSDSRSHDEENLVVLCLACHDEAHTQRKLSRNLTKEDLREFKSRWRQEVSSAAEGSVTASSNELAKLESALAHSVQRFDENQIHIGRRSLLNRDELLIYLDGFSDAMPHLKVKDLAARGLAKGALLAYLRNSLETLKSFGFDTKKRTQNLHTIVPRNNIGYFSKDIGQVEQNGKLKTNRREEASDILRRKWNNDRNSTEILIPAPYMHAYCILRTISKKNNINLRTHVLPGTFRESNNEVQKRCSQLSPPLVIALAQNAPMLSEFKYKAIAMLPPLPYSLIVQNGFPKTIPSSGISMKVVVRSDQQDSGGNRVVKWLMDQHILRDDTTREIVGRTNDGSAVRKSIEAIRDHSDLGLISWGMMTHILCLDSRFRCLSDKDESQRLYVMESVCLFAPSCFDDLEARALRDLIAWGERASLNTIFLPDIDSIMANDNISDIVMKHSYAFDSLAHP